MASRFKTSMTVEEIMQAMLSLGNEIQSFSELKEKLKDTDLYYSLSMATTTTLGGIKIGSGLVIDADGLVSVNINGFVPATELPLAAGTAAKGSSNRYAREDHVHPLQTTVSGSSGSCTGNAATATQFKDAQTVELTGDVEGSVSSTAGWSIITTLKDSGVNAGSYGPSTNATPGYGATFNVPYITVDAKGRVTQASTKTIKIPASDNTNTTYTLTQDTVDKHKLTFAGSDGTSVTIITPDTNTIYTLASLGIGNVKDYDQSKAIKSITRSGTTFTYTCLDGTTGTFTQQDNNTTYSNFVKSGSGAKAGLVPAPSTTEGTTKYLREDGTWTVPPNTTYTFANKAATLAWGTTSTIATVGGTDITIALPANPNTDTHWTSHLYAGGSGATANVSTSNGDTHLSICDNSTSRNSIKITGSGATTVTSDANGVITISSTNTTYTPASATPLVAGTGTVGTSAKYAREDHVHPVQTTVSGNAGSATKLATARTIDGVDFNGTAAIIHYGSCSTAAATVEKTVACTSFKLVAGSRIIVTFTVTNTAANPTLNVNSTGAKAIQYRKAAISAGYLAANRTYEFVYDGTQYQLVGDINTDTNNATAQNVSTANATYPVLLGNTADATANIGNKATLFGSGVKVNPSTSTVIATTFQGAFSGNASTATKFASAQSVALTGDVTGSTSSQAGWSVATTLANSGVTAGSYGPSANASPAHGKTFSVPYFTVDAKGRVTAASTKTITLPADNNTTYTFTAGTSALSWNTEVTLATVGGLAIKAKLPANPNTNTWNALKGATSSADGTAGYAPAPPKDGYNTKYLRADGTWSVPPDNNTTYTAASAAPKAPGTAAVGTSAKYAREDHVHPLQTTVSGSSGSCTGNAATATKIHRAPDGSTYVAAVTAGNALINSTTTNFGAIWNAPTKNYRVGCATYPGSNDTVYICYSVTNANVTAGTNTTAKTLTWDANTGTLNASGGFGGNAATATTAANVTGTVAIANGGTGATTRLNAIKALTNENVSTNATHFLGLKSDWSKVGYISVSDAKTVLGLGTAAYTASTAYAAASHTHSYLPLSGGTLTGELVYTGMRQTKAGYAYGTSHTSNQFWGLGFYDKNNLGLADILFYQNTSGNGGGNALEFRIFGNPFYSTSKPTAQIGCAIDQDGTRYGFCDTHPTTTLNNDVIATTKWVRAATGNTKLNAATASQAYLLRPSNIANGAYVDIYVVSASDKSTSGASNRVSTIRVTNGDGYNEVLLGVHNEANGAPGGISLRSTNGTYTVNLPGTTTGTFQGNLTGNVTGNATTASKAAQLTTTKYLWGNSFNGSGNVSGGIVMDANWVSMKHQSITKGTDPTAITYWTFGAYDKNGTNYANDCMGLFEACIESNGTISTYMRAMRNVASSTDNCQIACSYDKVNNKRITYAPTPPAGDNSTQIATTAWVTSNAVTTTNTSQDVAGSKRFLGSLLAKSAGYTKGTAPSSNQFTGVWCNDVNNAEIGRCMLFINKSMQMGWNLEIHKQFNATDATYVGVGVNVDGERYGQVYAQSFRPAVTNATSLGTSGLKWTTIYATTGTINTSDIRKKDLITTLPNEVLDAWEDVEWKQYKLKDSIEEKGIEAARMHTGVIAQEVQEAFSSHDLDPSKYGFFCYDSWDKEEQVVDNDGNVVYEGVEAGDTYSIRYEEALCIEAAYLRRENKQLKSKVADLEERLRKIEELLKLS